MKLSKLKPRPRGRLRLPNQKRLVLFSQQRESKIVKIRKLSLQHQLLYSVQKLQHLLAAYLVTLIQSQNLQLKVLPQSQQVDSLALLYLRQLDQTRNLGFLVPQTQPQRQEHQMPMVTTNLSRSLATQQHRQLEASLEQPQLLQVEGFSELSHQVEEACSDRTLEPHHSLATQMLALLSSARQAESSLLLLRPRMRAVITMKWRMMVKSHHLSTQVTLQRLSSRALQLLKTSNPTHTRSYSR